jgi:hypothetical protein
LREPTLRRRPAFLFSAFCFLLSAFQPDHV